MRGDRFKSGLANHQAEHQYEDPVHNQYGEWQEYGESGGLEQVGRASSRHLEGGVEEERHGRGGFTGGGGGGGGGGDGASDNADNCAWDRGAPWRPWTSQIDPVCCLELDVAWEGVSVDAYTQGLTQQAQRQQQQQHQKQELQRLQRQEQQQQLQQQQQQQQQQQGPRGSDAFSSAASGVDGSEGSVGRSTDAWDALLRPSHAQHWMVHVSRACVHA